MSAAAAAMDKQRNNSFRWSFDEVKYLFRGSNKSQRSQGQANSGKMFRFSFDDIKKNFWSMNSKRGSEAKNKKKRGAARSDDKGGPQGGVGDSSGSSAATGSSNDSPPDGKRRRKKLTPEERERRRQQREFDRRDKKSVRERERREHVGSLFGTLSNMLNVHSDTKDKTRVLEEAVASVKAVKKKRMDEDTVMTPASGVPTHRGRSRVATREGVGGKSRHGGGNSRHNHAPVMAGGGGGGGGSRNQTMGVATVSPRRQGQMNDQQRAFARNDMF